MTAIVLSRFWIAGILLAASGWSAHAATLAGMQGEVLVNAGLGFKRATDATVLNSGDQVVVSPGGAVQISYGENCAVSVPVGAIYRVAEKPPCTANGNDGGSQSAGADTPAGGQATGATAPAGGQAAGAAAASGGLATSTLIVGGVVVAAGAAAAIGLSGKSSSSSKPASP
ncbi:MAG: hypothetical protein SFW09_10645 [Hyphomicrobiaceae bacterium]|nr:hypothetical protein [Hyphomicrobiaceae bacterium]